MKFHKQCFSMKAGPVGAGKCSLVVGSLESSCPFPASISHAGPSKCSCFHEHRCCMEAGHGRAGDFQVIGIFRSCCRSAPPFFAAPRSHRVGRQPSGMRRGPERSLRAGRTPRLGDPQPAPRPSVPRGWDRAPLHERAPHVPPPHRPHISQHCA